MKVMFDGMSVEVQSAEELLEVARAKKLLASGGQIQPIHTDAISIAGFIDKLPNGAKQGFKALVDKNGSATAEELCSELGLSDNSALGAVLGSPVFRLAKTLNFPAERVFKKIQVVNGKGEKRALKYKIPPDALDEVRKALKNYFQ
jgi:hypothetical protein